MPVPFSLSISVVAMSTRTPRPSSPAGSVFFLGLAMPTRCLAFPKPYGTLKPHQRAGWQIGLHSAVGSAHTHSTMAAGWAYHGRRSRSPLVRRAIRAGERCPSAQKWVLVQRLFDITIPPVIYDFLRYFTLPQSVKLKGLSPKS